MAELDSTTKWSLDDDESGEETEAEHWSMQSYSELSLLDRLHVSADLNASQSLRNATLEIHQAHEGNEMLRVDAHASWLADGAAQMGVSGNASVYYNGDHVSLSQTRLRYAPPNGKSVEALSACSFKRLTLTLKALTTSRALGSSSPAPRSMTFQTLGVGLSS